MIRTIIHIDGQKCNGCGLCVNACHEGAIVLKDGKAELLRDDYCDGLGDCLPVCPTGAITFEQREAEPYDEAAVKARMAATAQDKAPLPCGCPGSLARNLPRQIPSCGENTPFQGRKATEQIALSGQPGRSDESGESGPAVQNSQLRQWPVQIRLVPVNAPYFANAHLLIAADCTAYAYGDFHNRFMRNRITLIGCPKLDDGDYAEKLGAIIQNNAIKSVTLVRMEVPCCGGLEKALKEALRHSGKLIPWSVVTIAADGAILED